MISTSSENAHHMDKPNPTFSLDRPTRWSVMSIFALAISRDHLYFHLYSLKVWYDIDCSVFSGPKGIEGYFDYEAPDLWLQWMVHLGKDTSTRNIRKIRESNPTYSTDWSRKCDRQNNNYDKEMKKNARMKRRKSTIFRFRHQLKVCIKTDWCPHSIQNIQCERLNSDRQ